ncbi:MAG: YggS family pyridoxal phosphate-dependent enzyme [Pseudomonadota bacterium]
MTNVAKRLKIVRDDLALAEQKSGRERGSVTLVAVSKTHSQATVSEAIEAGQTVFGENRVQEAMAKWPDLKAKYENVELHLIGPLQSNKCANAVALFDVIETIDREKIAREISREIAKQGVDPRLFVQVNTGAEPQKAGVAVEETIEFVRLCEQEYDLNISGLMCIPPFGEDPGPHFDRLAELASACGLGELSMGMSGDYATAIEHGATQVRIGSAIFGERQVFRAE